MVITPKQFDAARKRAHLTLREADTFAEALGITIAPPEPSEAMVKLARAAERERDAKDARIAQLEGALRGMVFIYNYGDAASPDYRVSVMEEARAALEGRVQETTDGIA